MIPYARQHISNQDINFAKKILKSEYLTSGPTIIKFEKKVAEYCNAKFAVATNSATSALHIACLCLGLKKGDKIQYNSIKSFRPGIGVSPNLIKKVLGKKLKYNVKKYTAIKKKHF